MATTYILSEGTTVTVGTDTAEQITEFSTPSDSIEEIDITNMSTTGRKEFAMGLKDGGEASFTYIVPTGGGIAQGDAPVACSINMDGLSVPFMGYVKSCPYKGSTSGVVTQEVTIRVTGDV
jgi:hypothetical protein